MVRRVFIVQPNAQYVDMFNNHPDYKVVTHMLYADMIQFTGGSDVTPSYYGEKAHPTTYNSPERDKMEALLYKVALGKGLPMAGICRGGQFLHVMNGGKLYQNVSRHCGNHMVRDMRTDERYEVSSTHHQMMRDAYVEDGMVGIVIAVAEGMGGYKEEMHGKRVSRTDNVMCPFDHEVMYYPISNSLCFQPHPEFDGVEECKAYYFKCLEELLFDTDGDGDVAATVALAATS